MNRKRERQLGKAVRWGTKAALRLWSQKSRANLVHCVGACRWPGEYDQITLTYGRQFSSDGRVSRANLLAFLNAFERRWGRVPIMWKLEFQRRGAPHWMLFVQRVVEFLGERQSWGQRTWNRIVGAELARGCTWIEWRGPFLWYALKYAKKGAANKESQHQVPETYQHVGRWWGIRNNKPVWEEVGLSEREFFQARRVLVRHRRSQVRGRRLRVGGSVDGLWVLLAGAEGRAAGVAERVVSFVRKERANGQVRGQVGSDHPKYAGADAGTDAE